MLKVKRLDPRAILPTLGHAGEDLGFDVYALEDVTLPAGRATKVRTGIAVAFSLPGKTKYGLQVENRSSVSSNNIFVTAGQVDSGYRGEIIVILNASYAPGHGSVVVKAGDKIAQIRPVPVLADKVVEVEEFEEKTERGDAGFGSTGNSSPQPETTA